MSYIAQIYNIMIASPGDVSEERKVAREIILDWNNIHSFSRKIVLMPVGWELNTFPSMGERPQEIINGQILKDADILIGIFWTRIGTPTGKAPSGTVEEIEEHINSGKPAMLYFSNQPVVPSSIDNEQYQAVTKLKSDYQTRGLTNDFNSPEDFRIKFQRHLTMLLNKEEYQLVSSVETEDFDSKSSSKLTLSEAARTMLIECSKDTSGQIMKLSFIGGFTYQTNGQALNEDYEPRTKAKWDAALDDLLSLELVKPIGYKGQIFQITEKGYSMADILLSETI